MGRVTLFHSRGTRSANDNLLRGYTERRAWHTAFLFLEKIKKQFLFWKRWAAWGPQFSRTTGFCWRQQLPVSWGFAPLPVKSSLFRRGDGNSGFCKLTLGLKKQKKSTLSEWLAHAQKSLYQGVMLWRNNSRDNSASSLPLKTAGWRNLGGSKLSFFNCDFKTSYKASIAYWSFLFGLVQAKSVFWIFFTRWGWEQELYHSNLHHKYKSQHSHNLCEN